ncbi:MAG: hypothetical protein OSJ36_10545 [Odoribacter sp.]|nr:hypothetical protein [Odoribacter sp.]
MKADKLIELICHPENSKSEDLLELETLVSRYPYFQSARLLYLKALNTFAMARFRNELKSSTIYITDHKQFYKYLNDLLEFDHLQPVPQEDPHSLSNRVSDRIREINGYLTVNTVGIPANREPVREEEKRVREHIIQVDFPQSPPPSTPAPAPAPTTAPVPPQFMSTQGYPEGEIISNPIFLDNMPGVVNDYSDYESSSTPKQQPVYEVVERHSSGNYRIEPVPRFPQEAKEAEEAVQTGYINSIELIEEEKNEYPAIETSVPEEKKEKSPAEKKRERISLQELPEMLGNYRLEDDTPYEEEPSVSELAALVNKKKKNDKNKLIDKFITEEPTMPRGNLEAVENCDLSEESSMEKEDLFSETLAKIYIKQQLYEKAVATYIKLSLKYPEKSVYFAHRIEKIKAKINNNE